MPLLFIAFILTELNVAKEAMLNTTREYQDYSRDFDPHFKWQSFSKDSLLELLNLYSQLLYAVDGFWYLAVQEKISNEQALACDLWVWDRMVRYELNRTTKLLNFQGNDVATLMKAFQVSPWFSSIKSEINMKNRNHAILSVTHCPTLEALEKEGGERVESICGGVEPIIMKN